MQEYTLTLFNQDLQDHEGTRVNIINTALSNYLEEKGISLDDEDIEVKRNGGAKHYSHKRKLIISVKEGFIFNGLSLQIKYWLHDSLLPIKV